MSINRLPTTCARLTTSTLTDATGQAVLVHTIGCGHGRCAGAFGTLLDLGTADDDPTTALPIAGRWIVFPPGWVQDEDGEYRLSHYAQRKVAAGYRPKNRRGSVATSRGLMHPATTVRGPIVARCPRCGFRELIDPADWTLPRQ